MGLRLWKSECPVCAQGRAVLCPGHTKRGLAKRGTIGSQLQDAVGAAALGNGCGESSLVALIHRALGPGHLAGWDKPWWARVRRDLARPFP